VSTAEEAQSVSLLSSVPAAEEPKAVPLSLVTRLEEFRLKIEHANGRDLVQYRGALMPLVKVTEACSCATEGTQPMLVFADEHRSMGLWSTRSSTSSMSARHRGRSETSGCARVCVIKGKATESHRCRLLHAAGLRRLVHDEGWWFLAREDLRFCWSMTRPSSATC
jgi:two-component system chemotaxis sensor kinase CheA